MTFEVIHVDGLGYLYSEAVGRQIRRGKSADYFVLHLSVCELLSGSVNADNLNWPPSFYASWDGLCDE